MTNSIHAQFMHCWTKTIAKTLLNKDYKEKSSGNHPYGYDNELYQQTSFTTFKWYSITGISASMSYLKDLFLPLYISAVCLILFSTYLAYAMSRPHLITIYIEAYCFEIIPDIFFTLSLIAMVSYWLPIARMSMGSTLVHVILHIISQKEINVMGRLPEGHFQSMQ